MQDRFLGTLVVPSDAMVKDARDSFLGGYTGSLKFVEPRQGHPLFSEHLLSAHAKQFEIGNCFLVATLIELIERDPEFVRSLMIDHEDGTVTVRLFHQNEPVYYRIDKTVLAGQNGRIIDQHALYIKLLQKAFAIHRVMTMGQRGTLEEALNGGTLIDAMPVFLGERHVSYHAIEASWIKEKEALINQIQLLLFGGGAVKAELMALFQSLIREFPVLVQTPQSPLYPFFDLVAQLSSGMRAENGIYIFEILEECCKKLPERIEKQMPDKDKPETLQLTKEEFKSEILQKLLALKELYDQPESQALYRDLAEVIKKGEIQQSVYRFDPMDPTAVQQLQQLETTEYMPEHLTHYRTISEAIQGGKYVTVGTHEYKVPHISGHGFAGEGLLNGVVGKHAYAVVDVVQREKMINGVKQLRCYVVIINPWQTYRREYKDGRVCATKHTGHRSDHARLAKAGQRASFRIGHSMGPPSAAFNTPARSDQPVGGRFEVELSAFLKLFNGYAIGEVSEPSLRMLSHLYDFADQYLAAVPKAHRTQQLENIARNLVEDRKQGLRYGSHEEHLDAIKAMMGDECRQLTVCKPNIPSYTGYEATFYSFIMQLLKPTSAPTVIEDPLPQAEDAVPALIGQANQQNAQIIREKKDVHRQSMTMQSVFNVVYSVPQGSTRPLWKTFLGVPESKLAWAGYLLGGCVFTLLKNTVKLGLEALPLFVELRIDHVLKNHDLFTPLRAGLQMAGVVLKVIRMVARTILSPMNAYHAAREVHPVLGALSAIVSVVGYAGLLVLASPLIVAGLAATPLIPSVNIPVVGAVVAGIQQAGPFLIASLAKLGMAMASIPVIGSVLTTALSTMAAPVAKAVAIPLTNAVFGVLPALGSLMAVIHGAKVSVTAAIKKCIRKTPAVQEVVQTPPNSPTAVNDTTSNTDSPAPGLCLSGSAASIHSSLSHLDGSVPGSLAGSSDGDYYPDSDPQQRPCVSTHGFFADSTSLPNSVASSLDADPKNLPVPMMG